MKATVANPDQTPQNEVGQSPFAARYPLISALFAECRRDMMLAAAAIAFIFYGLVYAVAALTAKDFLTFQNAIIGGDFTVFWTAAKSAFNNNAAAIYQPEILAEFLNQAFPARGGFNLTWQYPPTMYLIIAPLGVLPYLPAHWLWSLGTAGLFAGALREFWRNNAALIIAFASAAAYQGFITGQTGFLTAALIAVAAGWADRKPVLAGIAAGLLTVKPQLGLLIPVAFVAAGCWRAFSAAAVTAIALAGVSFLMFGVDVWIAFYDAITAHGGRLNEDIFPYHKLISAYGALMVIGAPAAIALSVQGIITLGLAGFVFIVWRRTSEWDLRLIALCAAAPLASPYAFYYELPIMIAPLFLIARRGVQTGWLPFEKQGLMALWIAPVMPPGPESLPLAAIIASSAFALCARRVLTALNGGQQKT